MFPEPSETIDDFIVDTIDPIRKQGQHKWGHSLEHGCHDGYYQAHTHLSGQSSTHAL